MEQYQMGLTFIFGQDFIIQKWHIMTTIFIKQQKASHY